ncbi:MAG: hypothetical protein MJE66_23890, partial [Proteobacteria bacterium]|nr:hypothetical protein [Pseudomonadota bacterium]
PETGAAELAYVLNTVDSSLSVVDVSDPEAPQVLRQGKTIGSDPTPPDVRAGRALFMSARASTSGTFSCESCHPNGNMDQLQWTINTAESPEDGPDFPGAEPEPRTTMPIRGLRDTLPLHWEGNLADPFEGTGGGGFEGPSPGCFPGPENEVACIRNLVNASLSGVMCDQVGGCAVGPTGLPGGLTETERNQLATFQAALSYPPMPNRRPDDRLSDQALLGVQDFFTDEDGLGVADGVGQVINFAPVTCADNALGCHSLPLTVNTNSSTVGGFDAPSVRGMVDRFTMFSNGISSSEEALVLSQNCADGIEPLPKEVAAGTLPIQIVIEGDPCNIQSELIETFLGFGLAELPFPSGEEIWDPEVGMTERGSFLAIFEQIFALVYGVRGDRIWEYQEEVSVGLPGLTGRQLSLTPDNAQDPDTGAKLALLEAAADEGKIAAVARSRAKGELRYDRNTGLWKKGKASAVSGEALRQIAAETDDVITVIAELPPNISIGGPDRQPLLDIDPDVRAAEEGGVAPAIPRPQAGEPAVFRLGAKYVDPSATVLINGAVCGDCSFVPGAAEIGEPVIDVTVPGGFPAGINVMQVLNPDGWASNEMPVFGES